MTSALQTTLVGASLSMALCGPAAGQAGPPPASSLEDITACSLESDVVFIVTGRDATARRYKYAWDAAVDLARKLSGRIFRVELPDGMRWRHDCKANGYLFVNVSNGAAASGPWRAEDGRLCTHMRGSSASCNEVREQGQRLYLKRDNGDVIALNPQ